MAISLRSRREIELLKRAGGVVARVLSKMQEVIEPGVSTGELNEIAEKITAEQGAAGLFKGVRSPYAKRPFPAVICSSLNDQVVHGIPSRDVKVRQGDILSIDYGCRLDGYCGDAAITVPVGSVSDENRRLIDATKRILDIAIEISRPGVKWSQVAGAMQEYARRAGFAVVKDYVGHGIGKEMHEEPRVPNFVSEELLANDIVLAEGMILAVEPMINAGSHEVRTLKDGWTVVTRDGRCSAHFEHTIAIVKDGCEVLTV
jgi:methionyl aminopeptidase